MVRTIETSIELNQTSSDDLLQHLRRLPSDLRPTHFNLGEDEPRSAIGPDGSIPAALQARRSGYFLYGPSSSFEVSIDSRAGINLMGDLQVPPEEVRAFLLHFAPLHPSYGYAASPEERVARNRISHQLGLNKIEAWVGRRSDRWLPSLYWLNLVSEELVLRHGVPVSDLASASHQYVKLENGLHLFQLYERPEYWQSAQIYQKFSQRIPGLFEIEVAEKRIANTKNFFQLQEELHKWQAGQS